MEAKTHEAPFGELAKRLWTTTRNAMFLGRVAELKIRWLADALIPAIDGRNALGTACIVRALVEHTASYFYLCNLLNSLISSLQKAHQESQILGLVVSADEILAAVYHGVSPANKNAPIKAPHINDCLRIMEIRIPQVREVYAYLCEFVHPNYGSNVLVSSGSLGRGQLNPPSDLHRRPFFRFCRICSATIRSVESLSIELQRHIIILSSLTSRACRQDAKIPRVFAKREPKPQGDGKSRETAFFFPKARDAVEEIGMLYEFLEKQGVTGSCTREADYSRISDGVVYNVFETDSGKIWFKTLKHIAVRDAG